VDDTKKQKINETSKQNITTLLLYELLSTVMPLPAVTLTFDL